jgi:hypothetical protein
MSGRLAGSPADVLARHIDVARQRVVFTGVDKDFSAAMRSVISTAGVVMEWLGPAGRRAAG